MRRFTVSLPDDLYESLRRRCDKAVPPASLQQMIRFAVETVVESPDGPPAADPFDLGAVETVDATTPPRDTPSADLLAFTVHDGVFGLPIDSVETPASTTAIRPIPTSSRSLLGVTVFREALAEVHDAGALLTDRPLESPSGGSLLVLSSTPAPLLMVVDSIEGPAGADDLTWDPPPRSSPRWVAALAWNRDNVITVIEPRHFLDLD